MTITIGNDGRYNFHNACDITLRIAPDNYIYDTSGEQIVAVELTPSQIRQVENHFCGISDCLCGSTPRGWERVSDVRVTMHIK